MDDVEEQNLQPQACDRCWKRKQKCDRKRPQCTNCEKVGIKCVPRVRGRVLDSPSNGTNSEGAPGSFIHYMTKRIAFLESQLSSSVDTGPAVSKSPAVISTSSVNRHTRAGSGSPRAQSIDNAVNEVQYLSLSAMSGPDRQDQVLWESPNFATFTKEASKLSGQNPALSTVEAELDTDTSPPSLRDLEDYLRTTGANSLSHYIKVYCLLSTVDYPCISHQECVQALEVVLQAEVEGSVGQLIQTLPEEITVSAIAVALGTLLSFDKRARNTIQAKCTRICRYLLPVLAAQDSDHVTVQCLTMQAVLSLYNPSAGPTWYLVGLAITKAISIGLHRQQISMDDDPDEAGPELSKPLFWTLYTLDRAIAFAMDRPLSIEDSDITLEMPEASVQTLSTSHDAALECLHVWTIHHAELLSRWYRDTGANLHVYLSSYQYWRNTCKEILDRAHLRMSGTRRDYPAENIEHTLAAYLHKHETQLSCRALVQLCVIGSRRGFSAQTHEKCKSFVELEVPQFLSSLKYCIEHCNVSLTFLDAYDTFAATIVFVYCQQEPSGIQNVGGAQAHNRAFGIGISGMRTIITAMEIVQEVSEHFPPVQGLKEILWTFLSALEKSSATPRPMLLADNSTSPLDEAIQVLEAEIKGCSIQVPNHLQELMRSSLQMTR